MTDNIPSIRAFLLKTLKDFPWSYKTQGEVIAAFADHLLAARTKSWTSLERVGIHDLTMRQVQYALLWGKYHMQHLFHRLQHRYGRIDRRESVVVALDDTHTRRFGAKVFGAAPQYDHSTGGIQYQNVIVDCLVTSRSYLDVGYDLYLPRKFLEREVGHAKGLVTKITLALTRFRQQTERLLARGWRPHQIWWTSDAWYFCKQLVKAARESGVFFMMGAHRTTTCLLFGQPKSLEALFTSKPAWRYRTDPTTQALVFYQMKKLYMPDCGWCRIFAIRRGLSGSIKYYVTNKLDVTIDTFLKRWKTHWEVEALHNHLKKYIGFHECFSGRKIINLAFWNLVYVLWYLFRVYQDELKRQGRSYTFHQLWEAYCLDYDIERAQKHFRTTKQIRRIRRRFVKKWC